MSSPVKIPFKSVILIDKSLATAVYLQIARQLINAIQRGILMPGIQLPGSRALAEEIGVHRKTIIAAYDELDAQGWTETTPNKGTFISKNTERKRPDPFLGSNRQYLDSYPEQTGYSFRQSILLDWPPDLPNAELKFTDGLPDIRLAPLDKLGRMYSGILRRKSSREHLGYSHVEGNLFYREALAFYLNTTRGLHIDKGNVLTTRGVHMGIYLTSSVLLAPGDVVIVGQLGYYIANMIFQQAGATICSVPVDQDGISVEAVKDLCEKQRIRMLYLTPHHHYPTTVTLSAERRVELLNLSVKYGFIILEDDYDYDFHFNSSPLLPLASADSSGMVVYIGSFCKSLAPGLRAGYLIAPQNLIKALAKFRRIVDRQGDMLMEQTLGELLGEGEVNRHLRKLLKVYEERRQLMCTLFKDKLSDYVQFNAPPGGLAMWTQWDPSLNLMRISKNCQKKKLHLPPTLLYQNEHTTAMRLGFGNLNQDELVTAVSMLEDAVKSSGK
jgi:GntR family transcriptional regulator / MocR family aminotransferase